MEHIQGFTRSHWMPPSGECLRRIALTAPATQTARLQVGWYIIFMASAGGGGEVAGRWWSDATIASKILVPGSNSKNH
jgi:hypothetical protein